MTAESDDEEMTEDRVKEEVEGGSYGFWLLLFLEGKKSGRKFYEQSYQFSSTNVRHGICKQGSSQVDIQGLSTRLIQLARQSLVLYLSIQSQKSAFWRGTERYSMNYLLTYQSNNKSLVCNCLTSHAS